MTMTTMTTPNINPKPQAPNERAWPLGILIALTAFVAIILAMVTISIKVAPEVVTDDYYDAGYNLKDLLAKEKASAGLGWTVTVAQPGNQMAVLSVRDALGVPVDSLNGDVTFYRPSNRAFDLPARSVQSAGGGTYSIKLPRNLEPGSWQAIVVLQRGSQHYQQRLNFFVE
jgi:hypothetical protein